MKGEKKLVASLTLLHAASLDLSSDVLQLWAAERIFCRGISGSRSKRTTYITVDVLGDTSGDYSTLECPFSTISKK